MTLCNTTWTFSYLILMLAKQVNSVSSITCIKEETTDFEDYAIKKSFLHSSTRIGMDEYPYILQPLGKFGLSKPYSVNDPAR